MISDIFRRDLDLGLDPAGADAVPMMHDPMISQMCLHNVVSEPLKSLVNST